MRFKLLVVFTTLAYLGGVLSTHPAPQSSHTIDSGSASSSSTKAGTAAEVKPKRGYEMSERGRKRKLAILQAQREHRAETGTKRPYDLSPEVREARREGQKKGLETRRKAKQAAAAVAPKPQLPPKRTYNIGENGKRFKRESMARANAVRLEKKAAAKAQQVHSSSGSTSCQPSSEQHDCLSPGLNLSEHEIGEIMGLL